MHVKSITVVGDSGKEATIFLDGFHDKSVADIVILSTSFDTIRLHKISSEEQVWQAAQTIQSKLDGFRGTGGDVRQYRDLINSLQS